MANSIPEDKIREIRLAADIVEIISEAVHLKRTGKNLIGLCPFHSEKTPSFTVSPDKQMYHCFGCSEGGGVIDFVMKYDGLSFPEALKKLARRYGIDMPLRSLSPGQVRQMTEREALMNVNRLAADFYHRCLTAYRGGGAALAYLDARGIRQETIAQFKLGLAPAGWDVLSRFLVRKKVPPRLGELSGLIMPRKNGRGHIDRLRNRVIFPIFNRSQTVIGFGGRVMDDSLPKYMNSPETPVYTKGRSLYGIDRARQASRRTGAVYIVEGYLDLLALHQGGFANTVATLGTALTDDHVQLIKGLTGKAGKAILVFDSDTAGVNAAKRSIAVFDRGYVDAHILVLPEGHDPDSFIRASGAKAFEQSAKGAVGMISFLLTTAIAEHGTSIDGRMRVLEAMTPVLAAIGDGVKRSLHIREIAERLGVAESDVLGKVRLQSAQASPVSVREPVAENRIERQIVSMMFQFPEILPEIERAGVLNLFEDNTLKTIGMAILRQNRTASSRPGDVISQLSEPEQIRVATALAFSDNAWHYEGCSRLIDQFITSRRYRRDHISIDRQIKAAEEKNDQALLVKLLNQKQQMAVTHGKRKQTMPGTHSA